MNSGRIGTLIGLGLGLALCLFIFWPLFTSIREAEEYAKMESTAYAREIATAEAQATLVPLDVDFGYDEFKKVAESGDIYITDKLTFPEGLVAVPSTGSLDTTEGLVVYKHLELTAFGSDISVTQWHTQCDVGIPGILSIGGQDDDGNCSVVVNGPRWKIAVHFNGENWEIAVPDK